MDILSHLIWAIILGRIILLNTNLKIRLRSFAFWGAFPDIFAFSLLFTISFFTSGQFHPADHAKSLAPWLFSLTNFLYSVSHSLIVFLVFLILIYIVRKKVFYSLMGWGLHIIMDIPTHTREFFPTPFLWPIFNVQFNGIVWRQWWFLVGNYLLITIFLIYLYKKDIRDFCMGRIFKLKS